MKHRGYANALAGAISFAGFVGGPLRALLELLGAVQTIEWLDAMLDPSIFEGFNWQVPYTWAFVGSVALLIALNWDLGARALRNHKSRHTRNWDATAGRCINYLVEDALTGRNFPREENPRDVAMEVFATAARNGQIAVASATDSGTFKRIARRKLRNAVIKFDEEINGYVFEGPNDDRYTGLVVDRDEARRIWPSFHNRENILNL